MTRLEVLEDDIDLLGGALTEALDTLEAILESLNWRHYDQARLQVQTLLFAHGRITEQSIAHQRDLREAHDEIRRLRDENQAILRELARAKGAIA